MPDMRLDCEICYQPLTDAEQQRFYRVYDRLEYPHNMLLSITCNRCRAEKRAKQARMHAVLTDHFRETGR